MQHHHWNGSLIAVVALTLSAGCFGRITPEPEPATDATNGPAAAREQPEEAPLRDAATGQCSMVGQFDMFNVDEPAIIRFDASGRYVIHRADASADTTETSTGAYTFLGDEILIHPESDVRSDGYRCMSKATYRIDFDASCKLAELNNVWDNCTGARRYFETERTMLRRR